jgi:hypothetical protein
MPSLKRPGVRLQDSHLALLPHGCLAIGRARLPYVQHDRQGITMDVQLISFTVEFLPSCYSGARCVAGRSKRARGLRGSACNETSCRQDCAGPALGTPQNAVGPNLSPSIAMVRKPGAYECGMYQGGGEHMTCKPLSSHRVTSVGHSIPSRAESPGGMKSRSLACEQQERICGEACLPLLKAKGKTSLLRFFARLLTPCPHQVRRAK